MGKENNIKLAKDWKPKEPMDLSNYKVKHSINIIGEPVVNAAIEKARKALDRQFETDISKARKEFTEDLEAKYEDHPFSFDTTPYLLLNSKYTEMYNLLTKIVNEYGNRSGKNDELLPKEDQNDFIKEAMELIDEYKNNIPYLQMAGRSIRHASAGMPNKNFNSSGMKMAYAMAMQPIIIHSDFDKLQLKKAAKIYKATKKLEKFGIDAHEYPEDYAILLAEYFENLTKRQQEEYDNPVESMKELLKSMHIKAEILEEKTPQFLKDKRGLDNNQKKIRVKSNRKTNKRRK